MDAKQRRRLRVSSIRRSLLDFLHFAKKMPLVTAERRMRLGPLIDARNACSPKPAWTILFLKAFALVALRRPELRRSYCSLPWPHFYEHDESVGFFTAEREVDNEPVVLLGYRHHPETLSLIKLNDYLRRCQDGPVEEIKTYPRMLRMGYLPRFLRRLIWRLGQALGGPSWINNFGTFLLSSPAAHGAGMTTMLSVATSTLHYGLSDEDGSLDFRLTFDHRVYDGAAAARALADMERVLLTDVLREVQAWPTGQIKPAA